MMGDFIRILLGSRKVELPPHFSEDGRSIIAPEGWYNPHVSCTVRHGNMRITIPGPIGAKR